MANRAFIRVDNVTLANAATIDSCVCGLKAFASNSADTVTLKLGFVDADDPSAPTTLAALDALTMTSATVAWTPGDWIDGYVYLTPDLKTSLQEVVNRGGWASGQALILLIEDNSSSADAYRQASAFDYDTASEKAGIFVAHS